MNRVLVALGMLAIWLAARGAGAQVSVELSDLAERFNFMIIMEREDGKPTKFLYADNKGHVHVYRVENGKAKHEWETTNLGSRVTAVFVSDIDADGVENIVVSTLGGRIMIYSAETYRLEWENLQDPFDTIRCMASHNLDGDPQEELIFIADETLFIYDGDRMTVEWQSQNRFDAQEIVLGNVDNDEQVEIILNTGIVIDSRFYTVQFESEAPFGDRIRLLDINGDGIPEIVSENTDGAVRIFDIYAERELW